MWLPMVVNQLLGMAHWSGAVGDGPASGRRKVAPRYEIVAEPLALCVTPEATPQGPGAPTTDGTWAVSDKPAKDPSLEEILDFFFHGTARQTRSGNAKRLVISTTWPERRLKRPAYGPGVTSYRSPLIVSRSMTRGCPVTRRPPLVSTVSSSASSRLRSTVAGWYSVRRITLGALGDQGAHVRIELVELGGALEPVLSQVRPKLVLPDSLGRPGINTLHHPV